MKRADLNNAFVVPSHIMGQYDEIIELIEDEDEPRKNVPKEGTRRRSECYNLPKEYSSYSINKYVNIVNL